MKDKGVEYVQWLGSYQHGVRLAQAMQQAGFKPDLFLFDPVAYDAGLRRVRRLRRRRRDRRS